MNGAAMAHGTVDRARPYEALYERFRSNYNLPREIIPPFSERSNRGLHELKEKLGSFLENQTWQHQVHQSAPQNPIHQPPIQVPQPQTTTLENRNAAAAVAANLQKQETMKRKASQNHDLDLNLSLGMKSRNEKSMEGLGEEESGLTLSLSSSSLSSSKLRKLNEDETNNFTKSGKGGASTLDLTL